MLKDVSVKIDSSRPLTNVLGYMLLFLGIGLQLLGGSWFNPLLAYLMSIVGVGILYVTYVTAHRGKETNNIEFAQGWGVLGAIIGLVFRLLTPSGEVAKGLLYAALLCGAISLIIQVGMALFAWARHTKRTEAGGNQ